MLYCIVLGDTIRKAIQVKVSRDWSVSVLRETIWNKKKHYFDGIKVDEDQLKLLKVKISTEDKDLETEICAEIIEESEEMRPTRKVESYFNEKDNEKVLSDQETSDIRIIIELPSTAGKCLPMFYLSNKFAVETMIHILVVTFVNMLSRSPLELGRKRPITEEESKKCVIETWYHT